MMLLLLGICFLREAPEKAIGSARRAGKWGLTDEQERIIESVIGKKLRKLSMRSGSVSTLASSVDEAMKGNPDLANILTLLLRLTESSDTAHIPVVSPKDLTKIGAEATKIVMRWEQPEDPHYAKIAVELLTWLREFFEKRKGK